MEVLKVKDTVLKPGRPKIVVPITGNTPEKIIEEWTDMRIKRLRKEISYEDYIEWKLNYEIKEKL